MDWVLSIWRYNFNQDMKQTQDPTIIEKGVILESSFQRTVPTGVWLYTTKLWRQNLELERLFGETASANVGKNQEKNMKKNTKKNGHFLCCASFLKPLRPATLGSCFSHERKWSERRGPNSKRAHGTRITSRSSCAFRAWDHGMV